jgi:hypothetical protein
MKYQLEKGEVLTLFDSQEVRAVLVLDGRVWLTRQDDPRDYCLDKGSRLACDAHRVLVIEALEGASLAVVLTDRQSAHRARLTLTLSCRTQG